METVVLQGKPKRTGDGESPVQVLQMMKITPESQAERESIESGCIFRKRRRRQQEMICQ